MNCQTLLDVVKVEGTLQILPGSYYKSCCFAEVITDEGGPVWHLTSPSRTVKIDHIIDILDSSVRLTLYALLCIIILFHTVSQKLSCLVILCRYSGLTFHEGQQDHDLRYRDLALKPKKYFKACFNTNPRSISKHV